uniref:Uncharacterized protein n=1 Tax=Salix viminalis TaxID=40686 RepID=A0A6N2LFM6_SALVM
MCGCGHSLLDDDDDDKMPFSRGADTTHRPPHTNRQSLIGWLFRLSIVALYDTCLIGSHGIYVDPTSIFDVLFKYGSYSKSRVFHPSAAVSRKMDEDKHYHDN